LISTSDTLKLNPYADQVCREVCHAGHVVKEMFGPFYCDCGQSNCRAMKPLAERQAEDRQRIGMVNVA